MEVFAVAANVMAAVSLTLQLLDTLENIKEFWKIMENAPEEVNQIIGDLELLEGILDGVRKAYVRCYILNLVHPQRSNMSIAESSCVAQAVQTQFIFVQFLLLFNNVRGIFVECRNLQMNCEPDLQRDH
jgi:hypothetical protein